MYVPMYVNFFLAHEAGLRHKYKRLFLRARPIFRLGFEFGTYVCVCVRSQSVTVLDA